MHVTTILPAFILLSAFILLPAFILLRAFIKLANFRSYYQISYNIYLCTYLLLSELYIFLHVAYFRAYYVLHKHFLLRYYERPCDKNGGYLHMLLLLNILSEYLC